MEDSDDTMTPYWLALGKFVHRYAEIETAMHQVLRITCDVPDRTARALFSGTRVGAAVDLIKRLYTSRGQEAPAHLQKAFSQIGNVTKARDRLLHHGMQLEKGRIIVTDESKNVPARAFKHSLSVADLESLEEDAATIQACLICFWIEARRPDLIAKEHYLGWLELSRAPWRYKSPRPMKTRATIRGSARERKSPPQS